METPSRRQDRLLARPTLRTIAALAATVRFDRDDAYQEAALAVLLGAQTKRTVLCDVIDARRRWTHERAAATVRDGTPYRRPRASPSPETALVAARDAASLRAAVASLPPRERTVIEAHYFRGQELQHIAAAHGWGKPYATQVHRRALARLAGAAAALR